MSKNIVVFADGTGQEGGRGNNTNVYKLFNMVADRTAEQIVFYDRGLGTGWRKVSGNLFGAGMDQNIKECYTFIFENYLAGDKIYLIGFSRGAATVRSLSSFIHYFGILPQSRPELIDEAYEIYKIKDSKKRIQKAKSFVDRNHTMWTHIEFIGVWDTVSALGIPIKSVDVACQKVPFMRHSYHDFRLSPSVKYAYQALAINEYRETFHPVLWEKEKEEYQEIEQVWFVGSHTDIGGGYKEQEVSDIPLQWMTAKAISRGLLIYPNNRVSINPNVNGKVHDSRKDFPMNLYTKKRRKWDNQRDGIIKIHESVLERIFDVDGKPYKPWVLENEYEVVKN
ncbi:Peptidoglycan binding domain protein [hydrothermal vent metagenome]|uniref:Peptidoglycan binding domain protein n=1 Tax=hydrothermal vent metagenome TaxID=652676 RepID=A0A1W1BV05_9ZZZZ